LLENNSYNGSDIPPITKDIVVPPGGRTFPADFDEINPDDLTYTIPADADDIEYTISVTFENYTENKTCSFLNRPAFYVRTPLVIVHGIMGSELQIGDETVWSPWKVASEICDDFMDRLMCDENGATKEDVKPTRVIRQKASLFGTNIVLFGDIFGKLETYLKQQKYEFYKAGAEKGVPFSLSNISIDPDKPEDVFYFVYDWRMDNADAADNLETFTDNLLSAINLGNQNKISKVNIVTHSMGGLIAKKALANAPSFKDKIDKIIFLGTPNLGAADAFTMLKHGYGAPKYDEAFPVGRLEDLSNTITSLKAAKNALDLLPPYANQITMDQITSSVSLLITALEMLHDDPCYCNEGFELTKLGLTILSLIKGVANPPSALSAIASLASEVQHLLDLDKDRNFIKDCQVKKVLRNMPSAYQLLPSESYFEPYTEGYYELNDVNISAFEPMENELVTWYFVGGDFVDPTAFALDLKTQDPVPSYLRSQFSADTLQLLDSYDGSQSPSQDLYSALIYELNQILAVSGLHDIEAFQSIELSPETKTLIAENQQGEELIHLNRLYTLLQNAKEFHSQIDSFDIPGKSYAIVGCSKCTTAMLKENENSNTLTFVSGDGDGTVPLESALNINVTKKYAAKYAEHSNLPSQPGVRLLIRSLLKGYEEDFATSPFFPVDVYFDGFCGAPVCQTGGKFTIPVASFEFELPEITIRISDGGVTYSGVTTYIGPNGIHLGILGSDYKVTNDGVEIYVPEGSVYTLEFQGVDQEYLNIKFQLMTEGGVIKTYIFADLTLDIDGCGEVTFDLTDAMTDPVLRLDNECDGTFEVEDVPPSYILDEEQSNDFIAPVTTANITGTMGENDWYTSNVSITLTATDNAGGSGILATRYRFQGDDAYTDYAGPIQIMEPGTYTMTYYSMDRNLNKETEKVLEFKIDNIAPQVLSVTDEGYFSLGTASFSASWNIETGISGLQDVLYSLGNSPGAKDVIDWTSAGSVSQIDLTGLSLTESCSDKIYINVRGVNGAGATSDVISSDGIYILAAGGDPDGDGFDNEDEMAAGSNPCNEFSFPKATTTQLKKGFNFISIPAEVLFTNDLKDWLLFLGDSTEIEKVMVYDDQADKFITLVPGDPSNPSFTLEGGEGLIVYAKQDKQIAFESVLCSTHDLRPGFNLVGFACRDDGYTAFQLLNDLGSEHVSSIQRYSTERGAFETVGFAPDGQLVGIDFPIIPGEGYFIFMRQEVWDFRF
jgi:triacylglycerol esterase/lipase EstA (alpha/beta hydrolase family)